MLRSGVFATIFLVILDVDKSHAECEAFIEAEGKRNAFNSTGHNASAFTGDADVKIVGV